MGRSLLLCACFAAAALCGGASQAAPPEAKPPFVAAARPDLPGSVMAALRHAGLPRESLGFYAREVASQTPVAAMNEEHAFVLASTTKVVTSLAALDLLGHAFRWRTYAYVKGEVTGGRLRGDLLIVGGGDARLRTEELREWFADIRARGVQEIAGNIVLDRFAFQLSEADHANTPVPAHDRPHHMWPDALTLDEGEFTTRAVALLWAQAGGVLHGGVVDKAVSTGAGTLQRDAAGDLLLPWSILQSDPLPQVVHDINKTSNNLGARHLLLSLAQGFPLKAATLAAARDRVQRWLLGQGLDEDDIRIDNGSGLSRTERGKPRAMVQLLCNAWSGRNAQSFVDSLPIAGIDGTLAHRMRHGIATGHAFLKTGTLLDTRALAGYVRGRSGKVYAVAAMVNHPSAARATPALDALIEWLARHG